MKISKYSHWIVLFSSIILFLVNFLTRFGIAGNLVFWIGLPLIVSYFTGFKFKNIGLALIRKKDAPLIVLLFFLGIATAYYSSTIEETLEYYSLFDFNINFVSSWIVSLVGVEFFFRGFMLFGLENRFGKYSTIIQAIPYMLIHLGKPWTEFYFSFFVGIIFALINLRGRSFMPSFIVHLSGLWIVYLANA